MDGDEVFMLLACGVLTLLAASKWYGGLLTVTTIGCRSSQRLLLALMPVGCLVLLQFVLMCWAAHEVREQGEYDVLFLAGGATWLGLAGIVMRAIGISPRDDALESRNSAAVIAVCGGWLGAILTYGGGNIGEGPTIWTTFIPAALATLALLGSWILLEIVCRPTQAISIDRDVASAARLAGFLIAVGLVLGRSVAGDWHSWGETLRDFVAQAWPALLLTIAAAIMQTIWRPTPGQPRHPVFSRGLLPGFGLLAVAILYVFLLGPFNPVSAGG